jgi:putative Mg2+ transporter-C (MgtC) family protein
MERFFAPATFAEAVLRLVVATVLASAIGINRELRQKPAGLRTHALVGLGSALLTLVALALSGPGGEGDPTAPSRMMQGIVAGIGFIGGGVILHRDDEKGVHGLSTAASIWVVAAAGMAIGGGMWRSAVAAVILALVVLVVGRPIDKALHRIRPSDPSDAP